MAYASRAMQCNSQIWKVDLLTLRRAFTQDRIWDCVQSMPLFGVRRPGAALAGCDLSQLRNLNSRQETASSRRGPKRRQAAALQGEARFETDSLAFS